MLALPFARLPQRYQQSQDTPLSEIRSSEKPVGVTLASQQSISRGESSSSQHSASGQCRHTKPALAPPVVFTGQSQPPPSNPLLSSAFGTKSQDPMMIINTGGGLQQVPINTQVASKAADEKRKQNATASHRFRQRRKVKETENAKTISNLEQHITKLKGDNEFLRAERDFYYKERDFFRDVATRTSSQASILPRPLSPRQRHTACGDSEKLFFCPPANLRT